MQEHFPQYHSGLNEPVQNVSSQMKATLSFSVAISVATSSAHGSVGMPSMVLRGGMRAMQVETVPYIYHARVLCLYKDIEVSEQTTTIGCVTTATVIGCLSGVRQTL